MTIREALTFDDVLLVPAASDSCRDRSTRARDLTQHRRVRHPANFRRNGYGHRGWPCHRHGAGRRHGRHSPQPLASRNRPSRSAG